MHHVANRGSHRRTSSLFMRPAGYLAASTPMARFYAVAHGLDPNGLLRGRCLIPAPLSDDGGGIAGTATQRQLGGHPLQSLPSRHMAVSPCDSVSLQAPSLVLLFHTPRWVSDLIVGEHNENRFRRGSPRHHLNLCLVDGLFGVGRRSRGSLSRERALGKNVRLGTLLLRTSVGQAM